MSGTIKILFEEFPELKNQIIDDSGELRNFVNLYVDKVDIQTPEGMGASLQENSEIRIIPAVAGGSGDLTPQELVRYARHLSLPELGLEGQKKIKGAKILVIGAGGLGAPVTLYLAAAGIGKIGLVDDDIVEESNLQRQILYGVDAIGKPKVETAKSRLLNLNPYMEVETYQVLFTSDNALEIMKEYDLVIDCTDNFKTRYLVNDACVFLSKPNCYGSIFRFEGQASVFNYRNGPCYRCLYPEPPPPDLVPSCAEGGVLGVLPSIIGSIQATEALKIVTGIGTTLSCRFMIYDALDMEFTEIKLKKNPRCVVCGDSPAITELIDYDQFCGITKQEDTSMSKEITVKELKDMIDSGVNIKLIDVRENHERLIGKIDPSILIPMKEIPNHTSDFEKDEELIFYCRSGVRSNDVCKFMISKGFQNATNLKGGILAWSDEIDPSIPKY